MSPAKASVGLIAAFTPSAVKSPLLLPDGEKDVPAAGIFVPIKLGLTPEAELLNGRLSMLGLIVLISTAAFTGQPILNVSTLSNRQQTE